MEPRTLKRWLIAIGIVYLLFPRDLVFDFTGIGLIDDLLFAGLLLWFYRKQAGKAPARAAPKQEAPASKAAFDPYKVLGVPASASAAELRSAYRARMSEYHPDKVAHLGKEMQDLAHRKALEIQQAYERLRK